MSPGRARRGTPVLRSRTLSSRRIARDLVRHEARARHRIVGCRDPELESNRPCPIEPRPVLDPRRSASRRMIRVPSVSVASRPARIGVLSVAAVGNDRSPCR